MEHGYAREPGEAARWYEYLPDRYCSRALNDKGDLTCRLATCLIGRILPQLIGKRAGWAKRSHQHHKLSRKRDNPTLLLQHTIEHNSLELLASGAFEQKFVSRMLLLNLDGLHCPVDPRQLLWQ
jgi:hypothetical protein